MSAANAGHGRRRRSHRVAWLSIGYLASQDLPDRARPRLNPSPDRGRGTRGCAVAGECRRQWDWQATALRPLGFGVRTVRPGWRADPRGACRSGACRLAPRTGRTDRAHRDVPQLAAFVASCSTRQSRRGKNMSSSISGTQASAVRGPGPWIGDLYTPPKVLPDRLSTQSAPLAGAGWRILRLPAQRQKHASSAPAARNGPKNVPPSG